MKRILFLIIVLQVTISNSIPTCPCGQNQQNQGQMDIVNGQDAAKNAHPWQVRLMTTASFTFQQGRCAFDVWRNVCVWRKGSPNVCDSGRFIWEKKQQHHCGGSLLDSKTVLTAAHCLYSRTNNKNRKLVEGWNPEPGKIRKRDLLVVLGEHDTMISDPDEQVMDVRNTYLHPSYDHKTINFDFAIIRLRTPVTFTLSVSPVCLPSPDVDYDNRLATVTGWGSLWTKGPNPSILQEVDINTMTNEDCIKETKWQSYLITGNTICARSKNPARKNSCHGDSGGPLVTKDGEPSYKLIGVVSFAGKYCADWNQPSVFARVTSVLPWIKTKMNQDEC